MITFFTGAKKVSGLIGTFAPFTSSYFFSTAKSRLDCEESYLKRVMLRNGIDVDTTDDIENNIRGRMGNAAQRDESYNEKRRIVKWIRRKMDI